MRLLLFLWTPTRALQPVLCCCMSSSLFSCASSARCSLSKAPTVRLVVCHQRRRPTKRFLVDPTTLLVSSPSPEAGPSCRARNTVESRLDRSLIVAADRSARERRTMRQPLMSEERHEGGCKRQQPLIEWRKSAFSADRIADEHGRHPSINSSYPKRRRAKRTRSCMVSSIPRRVRA
jgi:hypothetical protein